MKTLEELNELAQENGFGGAHNAITCAVTYRQAYSEYLHKYEDIQKMFDAIKELLPAKMVALIDEREGENI